MPIVARLVRRPRLKSVHFRLIGLAAALTVQITALPEVYACDGASGPTPQPVLHDRYDKETMQSDLAELFQLLLLGLALQQPVPERDRCIACAGPR
jgi:hypothetical protein